MFDFPVCASPVRAGIDRYVADRSPCSLDEAAIRRYFTELPRCRGGRSASGFLRDVGSPMLSLVGRLFGREHARRAASQTTADYLAELFSDPRPRALWLRGGAITDCHSQVRSLTHAMVASHYLDGGFYPVGVPAASPQGGPGHRARLWRGAARLRCRARDPGRKWARGRRAGARGTGRGEVERVLRAPHIVSNAGAEITYRKLWLDAPRPEAARREQDAIAPGPSHVNLFIGFRTTRASSASAVKITGCSIAWITTRSSPDAMRLLRNRPHFAYVTFPRSKIRQRDVTPARSSPSPATMPSAPGVSSRGWIAATSTRRSSVASPTRSSTLSTSVPRLSPIDRLRRGLDADHHRAPGRPSLRRHLRRRQGVPSAAAWSAPASAADRKPVPGQRRLWCTAFWAPPSAVRLPWRGPRRRRQGLVRVLAGIGRGPTPKPSSPPAQRWSRGALAQETTAPQVQ